MVAVVADNLAKQMDTKVFDTKIREAVVLSELVIKHQGITDYAPTSNAADDIRNVVKEIERMVK